MTNPMMNAPRSSLSTKAGTSVRSSTESRSFGSGLSAAWVPLWYYLFRDSPAESRFVNQAELDQVVPVLVEGVSKRDESMLSGRSPKNQTVHAPIPAGKTIDDYIGTIVDVHVDEARTWYLRGQLVGETF